MENPDNHYNYWKLSTLLGLLLLVLVLFFRATELQPEPGNNAAASKAQADFLAVKVGNVRAVIQWNVQQE